MVQASGKVLKTSPSLPHHHIPSLPPSVLRKALSRLSAASLAKLALFWCTLPQTQPRLRASDVNKGSQKNHVISASEFFASASSRTKKQLVEHILVDFWHAGLNLLQLAQIDCQALIDAPQAGKWQTARVVDGFGALRSASLLTPLQAVRRISYALGGLYTHHVYACRHPVYPAVIIRVHTPHKRVPFFVVLAALAARVVHSAFPQNDTFARSVLQSVEKALGEGFYLESDGEAAFNGFEAVFLRCGVSRYQAVGGAWQVYGQGVDKLPFVVDDGVYKVLDEPLVLDNEVIANLRFKGTEDGQLHGEVFEKGRHCTGELLVERNRYSSVAPILQRTFKVGTKCKFEMVLEGTDVFGGLHELGAKGIIDVERAPGWLTGE